MQSIAVATTYARVVYKRRQFSVMTTSLEWWKLLDEIRKLFRNSEKCSRGARKRICWQTMAVGGELVKLLVFCMHCGGKSMKQLRPFWSIDNVSDMRWKQAGATQPRANPSERKTSNKIGKLIQFSSSPSPPPPPTPGDAVDMLLKSIDRKLDRARVEDFYCCFLASEFVSFIIGWVWDYFWSLLEVVQLAVDYVSPEIEWRNLQSSACR